MSLLIPSEGISGGIASMHGRQLHYLRYHVSCSWRKSQTEMYFNVAAAGLVECCMLCTLWRKSAKQALRLLESA